MSQQQIEAFLMTLESVERSEAFGYIFFFVGDERMLPFATLASQDSEYDHQSQLDREGVFRVNIGVSRATFEELVGHIPVEGCDFTQLDRFLPHPDYAKQRFLCILSPTGERFERTLALLREAHGLALARQQRKWKSQRDQGG